MSEDLGQTWAIDIGNWWKNIEDADALRAVQIPLKSKADLESLAGQNGGGKWLTTKNVENAVWGADFEGIARKDDSGKFVGRATWKRCWGM